MRALIFTDPHRGLNQKTANIQDLVFKSIDPSSFDIVIVSGDWGVSKINHVKSSFKAFRMAFPDKPIIGVLGNHDLWDKKIKSLSNKMKKIREFAKRYNIHLLENNPLEIDNYCFLGFNGWYVGDHGDTQDFDYIFPFVNGENLDNYLNREAYNSLINMIDYPKEGKTVISITHFPCISGESMGNPHLNGNPSFGDQLLKFSDLIIFGHTHQAVDIVKDEVRIVNVGNDYNKLMFKIIDLKNILNLPDLTPKP